MNNNTDVRKSIFPTFEQIQQGKRVYTRTYYRSVKGEKRISEQLKQRVLIIHSSALLCNLEVYIKRSTHKKPLGFTFEVFNDGADTPLFEYSEQGWNDCIACIKNILLEYRKHIERIVNEY